MVREVVCWNIDEECDEDSNDVITEGVKYSLFEAEEITEDLEIFVGGARIRKSPPTRFRRISRIQAKILLLVDRLVDDKIEAIIELGSLL